MTDNNNVPDAKKFLPAHVYNDLAARGQLDFRPEGLARRARAADATEKIGRPGHWLGHQKSLLGDER